MRKIIKLTAGIMAVVIIGASIFIVGFRYYNIPEKNTADTGDIIFNINSGDTAIGIGNRLEEAGLIKSARVFVLYAKLKKTSRSFKTGSYRFKPGEKMSIIHDILVDGKQKLFKVTIPEGWTIKQIAALLERKGITKAEDFKKACSNPSLLSKYSIPAESAEGYIFPDTYMMQKNFPADKVTDFLISSFFNHLEEIYPDYKKLTSRGLNDKIILASIVEREYRISKEAPLIAGVFYNRLNSSMSLGSCATIAYIITDIEDKKHPSRITYDDLEIDSPYNTYVNKGLPPAPISNPGNVALKAVFYPAKTDYMFFLLEDEKTGEHIFTVNYGDHLKAKNLYIKTR